MKPENDPQHLADRHWFVSLLAGKGFNRSSPDTFTNGKASIRVDGSKFTAYPGTGHKSWNSDCLDADEATVEMILDQILRMRPFLSDAQLDMERAESERARQAITGIANTIKECPHTQSGVQLRQFLWSLYNSYHLVNLYQMTTALDLKRGTWVAEVFAGAFAGGLKEDDIKQAMHVAGEMERWTATRPTCEAQQHLDEAMRQIEALLRIMPPSHTHTEARMARERLWEAQESLRRAKEPT